MSFSAPVGEPVLSTGGSSPAAEEGRTGAVPSFCLKSRYLKHCKSTKVA